MSQTFHLYCPETKKQVWVGQGWGIMQSFYSGDAKIMEALKWFLSDHEGKPLVLLEMNRLPHEASEYETPKFTGCGDCDPCLGGRPDQCAVDPQRLGP